MADPPPKRTKRVKKKMTAFIGFSAEHGQDSSNRHLPHVWGLGGHPTDTFNIFSGLQVWSTEGSLGYSTFPRQNLKWPSKCTCLDLFKSPSSSVQAIGAEYHKPGRWGTAGTLLIVLEGGKSVVKALTLSVSGAHLVPRLCLLHALHMVEEVGGCSSETLMPGIWPTPVKSRGGRRGKGGEEKRFQYMNLVGGSKLFRPRQAASDAWPWQSTFPNRPAGIPADTVCSCLCFQTQMNVHRS